MTKLDELKARVYDTRVFYHLNAEATLHVSTIKELIAAVEALRSVIEETYDGQKMSADTRRKARAALAPFGE